MFIEYHDLEGNSLMVNFGAVLYFSRNPMEKEGSVLTLTGGIVVEVKETVKDIQRQLQEFALRAQFSGQRVQ